jgi:hypothetical protein
MWPGLTVVTCGGPDRLRRHPAIRLTEVCPRAAFSRWCLIEVGPPGPFSRGVSFNLAHRHRSASLRAGFGPRGERLRPGSASILGGRARRRPAAPPCRRGSRWPRGRSGDGRVSGPRLPRWPTAWPPAAIRQHISPGGALWALPPQASDAYCPFRTNGTNYPRQCSVRAPLGEGGVSHLTNGRPRASLDWIPGSATPQRWKHDGVHSLADAPQPRADPSGSGHAPEVGGQ